MADRAEQREREPASKADYKDERDRDPLTKDYGSSKDYAKDFPPRDYPSAKDFSRSNSEHQNKIYVGGLNYSATKDDIHDVFSKAGKVLNVQLVVDQETHRSKGYAFITFADEDSYLYALKRMDGVDIKGRNVVVNKALNPEEKAQWERERGVKRDRDPDGGRYVPSARPYHSEKPHYDKPPGPKSKGFRVTVTGLPETYAWRDLKDFLRNTTNAQPTYANVERPGTGVGEWATAAERTNAIRLLDGITIEGCRIRCEPLDEDRGGNDGHGGGGGGSYHRSERGGGGGYDDPGYSRGERGRGGGGGGGGGFEDRYHSAPYESGGGGGGRGGGGGGYDDRYPEKHASRGEGAGGRAGGYEGGGGGRYDGGGGGGRYEGSRDAVREPGGYGREPAAAGYSSRDPGYSSRDPGYSSRDGGRDAGGYGPGGGYSARDGGAYVPGGGYSAREGGGRGGAAYDDRYPEKYAGRGEYPAGGAARAGGYGGEGGRGGRYEDAGYEGSRREPGYGPPPKEPYSGPPVGRDRDAGYGPRDAAYAGSRGGGGGRDQTYERVGPPPERGGGGGYERGGGGYERGGGGGYERGYDRGDDGYGYEGGGGYKTGVGAGGYGGSGRAPAAAVPAGSAGRAGGGGAAGGYPVDGYEGSGRGGPDRNYAVGRSGGYERPAPY